MIVTEFVLPVHCHNLCTEFGVKVFVFWITCTKKHVVVCWKMLYEWTVVRDAYANCQCFLETQRCWNAYL